MARIWEYHCPTQVHFGRGALLKLDEAVRSLGQSTMLVGYRDRLTLDAAYDRAVTAIQRAGIEVSTFFRVPPEPSEEIVLEGARRAVEDRVRVIVALGGGSVIDAAKGIAAVARVDGALWDYAMGNPQARPISEALPVIAVPTTFGTGSEVSPVAVFTLAGVGSYPEDAVKAVVFSSVLYPRVALIDPELARSCPPGLIASGAADALGHALEAYLSRRTNPMSSLLASKAVGLIHRNLRPAVEQPDNVQLRECLALAAMLGGAAFTAAGVGVGHAIAHALGGVLQVPHGIAVAVAMAASVRFNAKQCRTQYAELAEACGIGGTSPDEQAARFVDQIQQLLKSVGLPDRVPVSAGSSADLVDRLVRNAFQSMATGIALNPRRVDAETLARLFEEVLDPVDVARCPPVGPRLQL